MKSLSDYLLYQALVRPDVLKNRTGSYLAAWSISGKDTGTLADSEVKNAAYQIAATIGTLPVGTVLHLYERRIPFHQYDRGLGLDNPVLRVIDDLRADYFLRKEQTFTTERTLTLAWSPPRGSKEMLRSAASSGVDAQRRNEDALLDEFAALCAKFEGSLTDIARPRRLGEIFVQERRQSELLAFVALCVDGRDIQYVVPPSDIPLHDLLSVEATGGYDVRVGNDEVGCIELKSFPEAVIPGILDKLAELKIGHMLSIRYIAQTVLATRKEYRKAILDYKGSAEFHVGFEDPAAMADAQQAVQAYGEAGGDYTRAGLVSVVITLRARERIEVQRAQRMVIGVLEDAGFRAEVRHMGAFSTWLSTLPGDVVSGTRKYPLSALVVAKMYPLHEQAMGRRWAESEALPAHVPATLYALGRGNSLTRMHLNVNDVWHGFGVGKTGAGKSVMVQAIAASFRGRLPYAGVTTIDRGRSSYRFAAMLDGTFYDPLGANSPGFALFAEAGDPQKDRELLQILEEMVELQGVRVTSECHERLAMALAQMASGRKENRSLYAFHDLLQPDQAGLLRPAIAAYTRLGDLGDLLDASHDDFDVSRVNVIDIERIIGLSPKYLIPILRVVVWKTMSQIRRMRETNPGLHWLIQIDEAHSLLRHPIGARFISDIQQLGRKENVGIFLWTNELTTFTANPEYRNTLLLNSPTRIYFADSGATESDPETLKRYADLQLPARGIAMLPNLPSRSFVFHQPDASVLTALNLGITPDVLAIIGTSRGNAAVDHYRAQYPVEHYGPHYWKTALLQSDKAFDAANRFEALVVAERTLTHA